MIMTDEYYIVMNPGEEARPLQIGEDGTPRVLSAEEYQRLTKGQPQRGPSGSAVVVIDENGCEVQGFRSEEPYFTLQEDGTYLEIPAGSFCVGEEFEEENDQDEGDVLWDGAVGIEGSSVIECEDDVVEADDTTTIQEFYGYVADKNLTSVPGTDIVVDDISVNADGCEIIGSAEISEVDTFGHDVSVSSATPVTSHGWTYKTVDASANVPVIVKAKRGRPKKSGITTGDHTAVCLATNNESIIVNSSSGSILKTIETSARNDKDNTNLCGRSKREAKARDNSNPYAKVFNKSPLRGKRARYASGESTSTLSDNGGISRSKKAIKSPSTINLTEETDLGLSAQEEINVENLEKEFLTDDSVVKIGCTTESNIVSHVDHAITSPRSDKIRFSHVKLSNQNESDLVLYNDPAELTTERNRNNSGDTLSVPEESCEATDIESLQYLNEESHNVVSCANSGNMVTYGVEQGVGFGSLVDNNAGDNIYDTNIMTDGVVKDGDAFIAESDTAVNDEFSGSTVNNTGNTVTVEDIGMDSELLHVTNKELSSGDAMIEETNNDGMLTVESNDRCNNVEQYNIMSDSTSQVISDSLETNEQLNNIPVNTVCEQVKELKETTEDKNLKSCKVSRGRPPGRKSTRKKAAVSEEQIDLSNLGSKDDLSSKDLLARDTKVEMIQSFEKDLNDSSSTVNAEEQCSRIKDEVVEDNSDVAGYNNVNITESLMGEGASGLTSEHMDINTDVAVHSGGVDGEHNVIDHTGLVALSSDNIAIHTGSSGVTVQSQLPVAAKIDMHAFEEKVSGDVDLEKNLVEKVEKETRGRRGRKGRGSVAGKSVSEKNEEGRSGGVEEKLRNTEELQTSEQQRNVECLVIQENVNNGKSVNIEKEKLENVNKGMNKQENVNKEKENVNSEEDKDLSVSRDGNVNENKEEEQRLTRSSRKKNTDVDTIRRNNSESRMVGGGPKQSSSESLKSDVYRTDLELARARSDLLDTDKDLLDIEKSIKEDEEHVNHDIVDKNESQVTADDGQSEQNAEVSFKQVDGVRSSKKRSKNKNSEMKKPAQREDSLDGSGIDRVSVDGMEEDGAVRTQRDVEMEALRKRVAELEQIIERSKLSSSAQSSSSHTTAQTPMSAHSRAPAVPEVIEAARRAAEIDLRKRRALEAEFDLRMKNLIHREQVLERETRRHKEMLIRDKKSLEQSMISLAEERESLRRARNRFSKNSLKKSQKRNKSDDEDDDDDVQENRNKIRRKSSTAAAGNSEETEQPSEAERVEAQKDKKPVKRRASEIAAENKKRQKLQKELEEKKNAEIMDEVNFVKELLISENTQDENALMEKNSKHVIPLDDIVSRRVEGSSFTLNDFRFDEEKSFCFEGEEETRRLSFEGRKQIARKRSDSSERDEELDDTNMEEREEEDGDQETGITSPGLPASDNNVDKSTVAADKSTECVTTSKDGNVSQSVKINEEAKDEKEKNENSDVKSSNKSDNKHSKESKEKKDRKLSLDEKTDAKESKQEESEHRSMREHGSTKKTSPEKNSKSSDSNKELKRLNSDDSTKSSKSPSHHQHTESKEDKKSDDNKHERSSSKNNGKSESHRSSKSEKISDKSEEKKSESSSKHDKERKRSSEKHSEKYAEKKHHSHHNDKSSRRKSSVEGEASGGEGGEKRSGRRGSVNESSGQKNSESSHRERTAESSILKEKTAESSKSREKASESSKQKEKASESSKEKASESRNKEKTVESSKSKDKFAEALDAKISRRRSSADSNKQK